MKYTIDTHTHTLVSGHAYNTIDEMAAYAAGIGVTHLAITDHAPKMPGRAGILYFSNMRCCLKRHLFDHSNAKQT